MTSDSTPTFSGSAQPVRCGSASATCAAQFSYDPDGAGLLGASAGTAITVAPDGLTASVTFAALAGIVIATADTLTYTPSGTAADRVKDAAGNDLAAGTVSPAN